MLRILIADDHEIVRRGLKQLLLEGIPSVQVEQAVDCPSLVEKAITGTFDIVVTDLAMPGGGGLEALKQIRQHAPQLPVLILSIYPEEQYARRVMKAGAAGYLNKDAAPEELVIAVQCILSGKQYHSESIAKKLSPQFHRQAGMQMHELLSDREMDVFILLAGGKPVNEIGASLLLSVSTVSTYRSRILAKMDMKTNTDITRYAIENKLI